jgi:hypothetical protein
MCNSITVAMLLLKWPAFSVWSSKFSTCGICDGRNGTDGGFTLSPSVLSFICHSIIVLSPSLTYLLTKVHLNVILPATPRSS